MDGHYTNSAATPSVNIENVNNCSIYPENAVPFIMKINTPDI